MVLDLQELISPQGSFSRKIESRKPHLGKEKDLADDSKVTKIITEL